MAAVVVALATAVAVLGFVLWSVMRSMTAERAAWTVERQRLVDRAIARHAGEALAFDRSNATGHQVVKNGPLDTPVAVGL